MMIKSIFHYSSLLLICIFSGCMSFPRYADFLPQVDTEASALPLLPEGNHLGMIVGFNAFNPQPTKDSIQMRWQEATNAGMQTGRLQIDWPELEPEQGVYDKEALEAQLRDIVSQNLNVFLTISVYDSDGPVVPEYLEGVSTSDEILLARFETLMDWVIPMLVQYKGWGIAIANEPDVWFEDNADLSSEISSFLENARSYIHQLDERVAVTITMNEHSLEKHPVETRRIAHGCDVVSLNYYGTEPEEGEAFSVQQVEREMTDILAFAGEKAIIFQELGMHTGSNLANSSEAIQQQFLDSFFQRMDEEERIRAAYIFQLVDWEPATTEIILDLLRQEGLDNSFVDLYGEVLNNIGLIRWEDGSRKPGWNTFEQWLKKMN